MDLRGNVTIGCGIGKTIKNKITAPASFACSTVTFIKMKLDV